jgi:hypothetical protein
VDSISIYEMFAKNLQYSVQQSKFEFWCTFFYQSAQLNQSLISTKLNCNGLTFIVVDVSALWEDCSFSDCFGEIKSAKNLTRPTVASSPFKFIAFLQARARKLLVFGRCESTVLVVVSAIFCPKLKWRY